MTECYSCRIEWKKFQLERKCSLCNNTFREKSSAGKELCKMCCIISQRQLKIILKKSKDLQSNSENMEVDVIEGEKAVDNELTKTVDADSFEKDQDINNDNDEIFTIFKTGSQKDKPLLVHKGYSYTLKDCIKNYKVWICSVRNKNQRCPGSINQSGERFSQGSKKHIHLPTQNIENKIRMRIEMKNKSKKEPESSGRRIVNDVLIKYHQTKNVSNMTNYRAMVSYQRRKHQHPKPNSNTI